MKKCYNLIRSNIPCEHNKVSYQILMTENKRVEVSLPFSKPFLKLQGIWSRLYKISAEVCNTLWPVQ